MNSEEDEFKRIEREALRRAAQDDDDTQVYADTLSIVYQRGFADGEKAAQQQAEPVAWNAGVPPMWPQQKEGETFSVAYIAQPEQQAEPVAWTTMPEAEDWCFVSGGKDPTGKLEGKWFPLYTTPPKRPWQGLTPEEILDMFDINNVYGSKWIEFARTVEAKLKEKNDH